MKSRIFALTAALCLVGLSACSNGKFSYGRALGDISGITGVETGLEEANDSGVIPTAVTAASEGPPLIVGFKDIRVALPLAGLSGSSKLYTSPDGVVIAMNSRFVVRATGLGIDLIGMYFEAGSPWLSGLKAASTERLTTVRVIEYWEKGRTKRDKFRCRLSERPRATGGKIVDETCKRFFQDFTFVNRYWLRKNGRFECSRQWIHPKLEPLQFFATEQQATTLDLTKDDC